MTLGHVVLSVGLSLYALGLGFSFPGSSGPSVQVSAVAFYGLRSVVLDGFGVPAGVIVFISWRLVVLALQWYHQHF